MEIYQKEFDFNIIKGYIIRSNIVIFALFKSNKKLIILCNRILKLFFLALKFENQGLNFKVYFSTL